MTSLVVFVFALLAFGALVTWGATPPRPQPDRAGYGFAVASDGDGATLNGQEFRLQGLDALEWNQYGRDADGRWVPWGKVAKAALAGRLAQGGVTWKTYNRDQYGRLIVRLYQGGEDLNEWLVREGLAVAYRRYSRDYVEAERDARAAKRGMWADPDSWVYPWTWRRKGWHRT